MRHFFSAASLLLFAALFFASVKVKVGPGGGTTSYPTMAELDAKYSADWNKPEYAAANSAANETYLSDKEKRIFYYLNLARMNPKLFATTYASGYEGANGYSNDNDFASNKASLIVDLNNLTTLPFLVPSRTMYDFAQCHAIGIGEKGLETHDRSQTGCASGNFGENISFGKLDALNVIMSLLIDTNVPSLGHRKNCLDLDYHSMGVSVQPHKTYGECAVMDFSIN